MKICYVGSVSDYSGYGNAARGNVLSLHKDGIPLVVRNHSFAPNISLMNADEKTIIDSLMTDEKCDVNIVHLTPENYRNHVLIDGVNVGHMAWETSRLPPVWIPFINRMDAMLVPCKWNVEVLRDSGVKVPVEVYPHAYDVHKFDDVDPLSAIATTFKDKLKFYSVFQWSERKNPVGLLRSYLCTFTSKDNVVLILKTYSGNGNENEKRFIRNGIAKVKESLNKTDFPPIVVLPDLMSSHKINQLHAACDVYLAPVRGEGLGIPILDAALCGNQVIATNYSGHVDFLDDEIHHLIPYTLRPVSNMMWIPWYLSDQMWADPDLVSMSERMCRIYETWIQTGSPHHAKSQNLGLYRKRLVDYYGHQNVNRMLLETLRGLGVQTKVPA